MHPPFGLGYHCKNMSALYGVHSRYSSCTNDERRASCQRDTLFRSTHAYQNHPACQARIRTKCDDTLPPTSDCVCFMARPWPHLFESWQTYYQHAPAKNDVFVQGWNAFIIYILIEFAIQISHSRVFISYFFANERILSDVSHVSHNIFEITHYKTTTYFVRMYHTYCEKTSVRTPSAPRCHLPHQNNWFLPIESAPKQKREKTSMFFSYSTIQRT